MSQKPPRKSQWTTFEEYVARRELNETDAIVASCKPTNTYQVMGACSDLKKKKRKP